MTRDDALDDKDLEAAPVEPKPPIIILKIGFGEGNHFACYFGPYSSREDASKAASALINHRLSLPGSRLVTDMTLIYLSDFAMALREGGD